MEGRARWPLHFGYRTNSTTPRLLRAARFCLELQRFERGKRVTLRSLGHDRRLENRVRPAWVRIDRQKQRVGCESAKVNDPVHDRLRWVRNLSIAFGGLIDEISQFGNLL